MQPGATSLNSNMIRDGHQPPPENQRPRPYQPPPPRRRTRIIMMRSVWVSMMSNPFSAMAPAWASPQYSPSPGCTLSGRSHRPCQPPQRVVTCGTHAVLLRSRREFAGEPSLEERFLAGFGELPEVCLHARLDAALSGCNVTAELPYNRVCMLSRLPLRPAASAPVPQTSRAATRRR